MGFKFPDVCKVGYGLMGFTWVPSRKFTQEQFSEALKAVLDKSGASCCKPLFLNGGEFYGIPDRYENISKIGQFFKTYPEYADKVYVSIKGGTDAQWAPDTSAENLETTLNAIAEHLKPLYDARVSKPKTLDMFTLCRLGNEPLKDTLTFLASKKKAGFFKDLCLSEISVESLEKAISITPISAIEMEYSLFERYLETNGIFKAAKEYNIPVICYSPLGKGLLVGVNAKGISKDDFRNHFDRFNDPKVVSHNEVLVLKVRQLAEQEKLTPAQLALSYITTVSNRTIDGISYPKLIPIPGSANAQRQIENISVVELSDDVIHELNQFLKSFETEGYRYNKQFESTLDK